MLRKKNLPFLHDVLGKNTAWFLILGLLSIFLVACGSYHYDELATAREDDAVEEMIVSGLRASVTEQESESLLRRTEVSAKHTLQPRIKTWRAAGEQANAATIKIGQKQSLSPEWVDIKVQIDGFRARVVVDGFYHNPHARQLEGDFKFRLPEGAKPYYFAFGEAVKYQREFLETGEFEMEKLGPNTSKQGYLSPEALTQNRQEYWKAPKQAVMVTREKAAFAYEDTVSRQIDPALMEWSGAGIFSASVFPLMPDSVNRIVIGYDINLQPHEGALYLDLALSKQLSKRVHFSFSGADRKTVQIQKVLDGQLDDAVQPNVEAGILQHSLKGKNLTGVRVKINNSTPAMLVGMDEVGDYFAQQWVAKLPQTSRYSKPKGVFLLDSSLSASPERFHLWVALLLETLKSNEAELKEFALASFNTNVHWWKDNFVKNTQENRKQLEQYLHTLILEGATDLSTVLNSASHFIGRTQKNHADIFLYSDGTASWGEQNPWLISEQLKKQFSGAIYSYRLGMTGEDKAFLDHLAREFNGAAFHLADKNDIAALAKAHTSVPWRIKGIELKGGQDIIMAGRPVTIYPGQVITIAGRKNGELGSALHLSLSNAEKELNIKIPVSKVLNSTLTARLYGEIAVNQLESLGDLKEKVAGAYAKHFRVPGKTSSLLMLESKADYERYHISPEQDAFVVKSMTLRSVFESLSESFSQIIASPKNAFIAGVGKLSKTPGINLSLPDAVSLLLDTMPAQAFDKPQQALSTQAFLQQQSSKSYRENLREATIYDTVEKEALKRLKKYGANDAIHVMSNLVERSPGDVSILRDVAYAAETWGRPMVAFNLHQRAMRQRPFEPQSYNYLAKLAEKIGLYDLAILYFEIGLAGQWHEKFRDFTLIHKMDYFSFLQRLEKNETTFFSKDYAQLKFTQLDKELDKPKDLLVVISWNTDRSDVDLHVLEPSGEECYYEKTRTASGGKISEDVTTGYGPEFYQNAKAPKGSYKIYVNYFGDDRNKLGLNTKVHIRVIRNWGGSNEQEQSFVTTLKSSAEKQLVLKTQI